MGVLLNRAWPSAFQRFFRTEAIGGLVLLSFGFAALVLANSPWAKAYEHLWQIPLTVGIDAAKLGILGGSLLVGIIATIILKTIGHGTKHPPPLYGEGRRNL